MPPSNSIPPERVEHALRALHQVETELKRLLSGVEGSIASAADRVGKVEHEIVNVIAQIADLRRDIARDSLVDAEFDQLTASRITELNRSVAEILAAKAHATAAIGDSQAEAQRGVRGTALAGAALNVMVAIVGLVAAGAEHIVPVIRWALSLH